MTRTTNAIPVLLCVLLAGLAIHSGAAAQVRMMGPDGENDILMLGELGLVVGVMPGDEELSVITLLPDADPGLEVKRGDLVLMINGQRMRDVAALREAYEATEIGDTVKVGFRRGDERFLTSFEKKEPQEQEMAHGGKPRDDARRARARISATCSRCGEFGVILGERRTGDDRRQPWSFPRVTAWPSRRGRRRSSSINGQDVGFAGRVPRRSTRNDRRSATDVALVALRARPCRGRRDSQQSPTDQVGHEASG